jgi:hypothetical protein
MSSRPQVRTQQAHSAEIRQVYERLLVGASVSSRQVEVAAGGRVHLLETGAGPPVVLLHGTWTACSTPWSWTPPRWSAIRGPRCRRPAAGCRSGLPRRRW